jgi:hypothetical protein
MGRISVVSVAKCTLLALVLGIGVRAQRASEPESFPDVVDHFKCGSIGTEERVGLPY